MDSPDPAAIVDAVIRSRRTSLLVDPEAPVPDEVIDELIEAATWAPNHKRTWPWSFTVITGASRARFGNALEIAGWDAGLPEAKVIKLPTKYLRSSAVLLVWCERDDDTHRHREDLYATAAAVQNVLLAATARGLGSYWASLPDALVPAARSYAEASDDAELVALIYLGWPTDDVPAPERPAPDVLHRR